MSNRNNNMDDPLAILVEILSCENLMKRGKKSTADPYVKVKFANKDIHQTKVIAKTTQPRFGDAQHNSFLLECTAHELTKEGGLLFKIKDHNRFGSDEDLGLVFVKAAQLMAATGAPMQLDLTPPPDVPSGTLAGISKLTLRSMPATEAHLKKFGSKFKSSGLRGFVSSKAKDIMDMPSSAKNLAEKMVTSSPSSLFKQNSGAAGGSAHSKRDIAEEQGIEAEIAVLPDASSRSGGEPNLKNEEEAAMSSSSKRHHPQPLKILVEIIGARDLLVGDSTGSSDPYVKVMLGDEEIHKTKHILKTLNPIYTPEKDSTFILECTDAELKSKGGLIFVVKDWDLVGKNDFLGEVQVACPTLMNGNGDGMEFMIVPPHNSPKKEAGYLLIRCRNATDVDEMLLRDKKKKNKNLFDISTEQAARAAWNLLPESEHPTTQSTPRKNYNNKATSMDSSSRHSASSARLAGNDSNHDSVVSATYLMSSEDLRESERQRVAEAIIASSEEQVSAPAAAAGNNGKDLDRNEELHVRVEIVSCRGLMIADRHSSDPYVKVKMAGKTIHETKPIKKTLHPVFSEETNHSFPLHTTVGELLESGGLLLKVKDWDMIGKHEDMGSVVIQATTMLENLTAENVEMKLNPPERKAKAKKEIKDAGFITIRLSRTRPDDVADKKAFLGIKKPNLKTPTIKHPIPLSFRKDSSERSAGSLESQPLFIEIASCRGLIAADANGYSDPYVKVKVGERDIHQTKYIPETLDPVFSPSKANYFVLDVPTKDLRTYGLMFKVKDYDRIGSNDDLGQVYVDADMLLNSNGETIELKLAPPKGHAEDAGYISFKCRPATEDDIEEKKDPLRKLKRHIVDPSKYGEPDLSLLVEVVSCWQLPKADVDGTSDPYVKIEIGPRDVHRTKPVMNTLDPIFTIDQNSVFVLDVAKKEIEENNGMTFTVKDYDFLGANDDLCAVVVPPEPILAATGERLEFELKHKAQYAGMIALRFREATDYDREFLEHITQGKGKDFMGMRGSYLKMMDIRNVLDVKGVASNVKSMLKKNHKEEMGIMKYRVRPNPDPDRDEEDTKYMSAGHIEAETYKASRKWLDVGSGNLGKIFVEILGCDGLPNKDTDLGTGNKTDSFVALVYEDAIAKTDVIDDCLSPRWLPWTQRAFVFNMMHPSSNLNIAVFDFDPGFGLHDMCGRVSVNLANLIQDTEYVLTYNLYESSTVSEREPQGTITMRLRMNLKPGKELLMAHLAYPPQFYVNTKNKKDFHMVRQTVGGKDDLLSYSTKTIQLYVDELRSYLVLQYYLFDAVVSLIFWRGQVSFMGGPYIPLHSAYFFLMCITLAEHPSYGPAFFFFNTAYMLMATQRWLNDTPNPWAKTKTFLGLFSAWAIGYHVSGPSKNIAAHQNEEESMELEKKANERIEKAMKKAEEHANERMRLMEEHEQQVATVGDQQANTDISTNTGGRISFDPMKFILYPIQQILAVLIAVLRFIKDIFEWDEPFLSFLLTVSFILVGAVLLFVPWAFLIRWTSRIIAWGVFGPHMKLVDIYWYRKFEQMTEEEQKAALKASYTTQLEAAKALASVARVQTEDAVKIKAVKQALFGKFITYVPVLSLQRFSDVPLHASSAKPYKPEPDQAPFDAERISGQHLVGTMIPRMIDSSNEFLDASEKFEAPKDEKSKKKD